MTKGKVVAIKVVDVSLDNALGDATIEWKVGYTPDLEFQKDAVFYQGEGRIAVVSYKGFEAEIFCDGEMRCYNTETQESYRQTIHFLDAGIETDKQLSEAHEKLEWDMNPWFDLYLYGEHLDDVQHDLVEAIASASAYVVEQYNNAQVIEGIDNLE